MPALIGLLISFLVLGLILWIIWWIITLIPVPPPFAVAVRVVFAIICLIALLSLIFGGWSFPWYGHPLLR